MPGPSPAPIPTTAAKAGSTSRWLLAKRIWGYLYAGVLPWFAAYLSFRLPALRGMRFALNFTAIAAASTFFGPWETLVAFVVSVLSFEHYLPNAPNPELAGIDRAIRAAVLFLAGGLVVLIIVQRRTAERKLREALATLREQAAALMQAQQASRSAAWTYNTKTQRTRWYAGGAEIFGRPHKEIVALGTPTSLMMEEDRAKMAAATEEALRAGKPFPTEYRVLWPNGEVHWLESRGAPLASDPTLWRGATIDITERKQAEEALLRTEKLAIAGRLAASIAHEINNPLEAVTNLCYLAKHTATDDETKGYIELAEAELSRVAHITTQTLRFHRQQTAPAETDLAEMVQSILSLYEHRLALVGITVQMETEPAEPLLCYAGEIRQVLANLIANAIDAMQQGGRLRLRVRPSTDWRTESPAVRVTVADTGRGMSPETRKRIYEPFYTTKGDSGTGLGLWITAGIIEKHKGSLGLRSVESAHGGSTFSLILPYPASVPGAGEGSSTKRTGAAATA